VTVETFDSSTSWTVPAGVTSVDVECWGGGAGGGASSNGEGGGGGGAYSKSTLSVTPSDSHQINIGAGGSAAATTKSLTFQGRSQMPYAPVHLTGTRGTAPQHWTVAWVRRTRLGGAWKDGLDVPLGEERETYEVDILDTLGSPPGAVVRTITESASPGGSFVTPASRQVRYSASDQIADFGAVQATLSLQVYQISATVGRGVPAAAGFAA